MISRRTALASGSAALFSGAFARAQSPGRVWRIGFLATGARMPEGRPPAALRNTLRGLGYLEGQNLEFASRFAEARHERLRQLVSELLDFKPDLLVTFQAPSADAARAATASLPIVFTSAGEAVATGLIASLARPGGNMTGVSEPAGELSAKRLEILKEAVPGATRIAVLWNAADRAMTLRYQEIEKAAERLRVVCQPLGVREPDDFEAAFSTMTRVPPDALFLVTDALTALNRKRVIEFASSRRIPAMYEFATIVRDGGLLSYGPSLDDMFGRAAALADKILKGAKPGEIPAEQPLRYYFALNLKTAAALGITIPQTTLLRADEVIE